MQVVLSGFQSSAVISLRLSAEFGQLFVSGSEETDSVTSTADAGDNLTLPGTQDEINAALMKVRYSAPPDWNSRGQGTFDTLSVVIDEEDSARGGDPYPGVPRTLVVLVVAVNDPPYLLGPPEVLALESYATAVPGIEVVDPDATEAAGSVIEVTVFASEPGSVVELGSALGIFFTQSSDKSKTFLGSLNSVNHALAGLTYRGPPEFSGRDLVEVAVDDLGNTGEGGPLSASLTVPIYVSSVNDPPRVVREGGLLVRGVEDESIKVGGVVVDDPDARGEKIRLTLTAVYGTVSFGANQSELHFVLGSGTQDTSAVVLGTIEVRCACCRRCDRRIL